MNENAQLAERLGAAAAYSGAGTSVYFGLSASQWSVLGVIGGLIIGCIGLAVNTYFQWKRDRREEGMR